jgi:hypothetical protein
MEQLFRLIFWGCYLAGLFSIMCIWVTFIAIVISMDNDTSNSSIA